MLRSTFLKCWDYPSIQDQKFFFSVEIFKIITFQSRLWRVKIFVKIGQDLLRRSEVCQEILRPFESENDEKSHQIEKSRHENAKIHALFNQDKLSRNAKIFRSWQISWSQSRLLVWTLMSRQNREVSISTKISRLLRRTFWCCQDFLNCRDALFDDSRSRHYRDKSRPSSLEITKRYYTSGYILFGKRISRSRVGTV